MPQMKSPNEELLNALENMKTRRKVSLEEVLAWEKAHELLRDAIKNEFLSDAISQGLLEVVEDKGEQGEDHFYGNYTAYSLKLKAPNGTSIYVRPLGKLTAESKPRVGVWTAEGGFNLWWNGERNWTIEPLDSVESDESKSIPLTRELFLQKLVQVLGA